MTSAENLSGIRQSLKNIQKKDPSAYSNNWSLMQRSENYADMERRFQRGRSEERYPHYYRGRSASPVRYHTRSHSAGPESFSYYGRSTSPSREVVTYSRSTSPVVYSRDYDFYYRPYSYYNYLTRPSYYATYPYYRPYYYSSLFNYRPWSSYYSSYYRPRYYSFYDYLPYRYLPSTTMKYLLDLDLPLRTSRYLSLTY